MGKNKTRLLPVDGSSRKDNINTINYNLISEEKGVGPKTQEKLLAILEFCNEKGLELRVGKSFKPNRELPEMFEGGRTARVTIIDPITGKQIHIFDDVLLTSASHVINKEALQNLLDGIRYEQSNTKESFHGIIKDVFITNHRLIKEDGNYIGVDDLGFFDPYYPNAIAIQSYQMSMQDLVKKPDGSYKMSYIRKTAEIMGDIVAHENAHAYDYHKTGTTGGLTKFSLGIDGKFPTLEAKIKIKENTIYHTECIS